MPDATGGGKSRYVSLLCQHCGFWFDGRVSGSALLCPQCGKPLQGEVSGVTAESPPATAGTRVLIADDSSLLRKAISKMLSDMGCEVKEAADGGEASQPIF